MCVATCGINSSARALRPRARGCVRCHRPGSRASAAGVTWTSRTLKAGWAARYGHTTVVDAAGAIYVIGGRGDGTDTFTGYFQDVWVSTDGGAGRTRSEGGRWGYSVGTRGVLSGTPGVL